MENGEYLRASWQRFRRIIGDNLQGESRRQEFGKAEIHNEDSVLFETLWSLHDYLRCPHQVVRVFQPPNFIHEPPSAHKSPSSPMHPVPPCIQFQRSLQFPNPSSSPITSCPPNSFLRVNWYRRRVKSTKKQILTRR
jgi:hypothetical protein